MQCRYFNDTNIAQIVRISEPSQWLERIVLPCSFITFSAEEHLRLEVYSSQFITCMLSARISCIDLRFDNSI
jgi:Domain of unknown function (DUF1830)